MEEFSEGEVAGPDAGFEEEKGGGGVVRGGGEFGNGFVELWEGETAVVKKKMMMGWWCVERRWKR